MERHWPLVRDALSFVVGAAMVMVEMGQEARDPIVLGMAGALLGIPAMATAKRNGVRRHE